MAVSFKLPVLLDNPNGWGPCTIPEEYKDLPFAPFNKSDRLGKISDWQASKIPGQRGRAGAHEEEDSFTFVDNTPKSKPKDGRKRYKKFSISNKRRRGRGYKSWGQNRQPWQNRTGKGGPQKRGQQPRRGFGYQQAVREDKPASVVISQEWVKKAELQFDDLSGSSERKPEVEELKACGSICKYDHKFDRVTTRMALPLQRSDRQHFTASTSEDPILKQYIAEKTGTVYATDTLLAALMASPRSVNPWDVIIRKKDGVLIIDKRPTSKLDFLSVNENWNEILEDDDDSVNHPAALSTEATFINHNFSQQVLQPGTEFAFENPNPFEDAVAAGHKAASVGYRYRKWKVGDHVIVARTSVNAYIDNKETGQKTFLSIRALNEFDSKLSGGVDYRQKLDAQSGAVLATEMKNNANKLARWTAETELSGAEEMRLGFVSRSNPTDSYKHLILMSARHKRDDFAQLVNVRRTALWGSLKKILDTLASFDDGRYLIIKDPNKPSLVFYDIGATTVEDAAPIERAPNDEGGWQR